MVAWGLGVGPGPATADKGMPSHMLSVSLFMLGIFRNPVLLGSKAE